VSRSISSRTLDLAYRLELPWEDGSYSGGMHTVGVLLSVALVDITRSTFLDLHLHKTGI
jgi:hypothetical protein